MVGIHAVRAVNRGLVNQGNSCYMNAATQCLTHVQPFIEYLKANEAQFRSNEQIKEFIILLNNIRDTAKAKDPREITAFNPKKFYNQSFVGPKYSQQDSSEFFIPLLDKINDLDKQPSIVQQTFGFKQISRLICPSCNFVKDNVEEILDLETFQVKSLKNSLELPLAFEENLELNQLLKNYFAQERLDDDNRWQCSRCNKYVNATKQLLLGNAPDFLIITLKRFPGPGLKDGRPVSFPLHNLNLKAFIADQQDTFYELIGIDIHHGGTGGGHYLAYCKDFEDKQWYQFNDDSVSFAHNIINNIAHQTADPGGPYILFYKRQAIIPINPEPIAPKPKPKTTEITAEELDGLAQQLLTLEATSDVKAALLMSLFDKYENAFFAKTKKGETPIHLFIDYLTYLFNNKSEIEISDPTFIKTCKLDAHECKEELNPETYFKYFEFLVENFDINAQLPVSQETIMHRLLENKDLQDDIDANAKLDENHKFLNFLTILLNRKPNYNLVNKDGKTPFYLVIENLTSETTTLAYQLIDAYRVHIDVPSYNKQNVLHLLMRQGGDNRKFAVNILQYIIDNISIENFSNHTPHPKKGLCYLIKTQDDYGKTPLHYALEKNNIDGAKILLNLLFEHKLGNSALFKLISNTYSGTPGKSIQELIEANGLTDFVEQLKKANPDQEEPLNEKDISKMLVSTFQALSNNDKIKEAIVQSIGRFKTLKNDILFEIKDKSPQPSQDELLNLVKEKILSIILKSPLEQKLNSLTTNLKALQAKLATLKESLNKLKQKLGP